MESNSYIQKEIIRQINRDVKLLKNSIVASKHTLQSLEKGGRISLAIQEKIHELRSFVLANTIQPE